MSPLELVLFGAARYLFGLVSGGFLIPRLVDRGLSLAAGMSDDRRPPAEYRWTRQVSAVLLIVVPPCVRA